MNSGLEQKFEQLEEQVLASTEETKVWKDLTTRLKFIKKMVANNLDQALLELDDLGKSIIDKISRKHWKSLEQSIEEIKTGLQSIQSITADTSARAKATTQA